MRVMHWPRRVRRSRRRETFTAAALAALFATTAACGSGGTTQVRADTSTTSSTSSTTEAPTTTATGASTSTSTTSSTSSTSSTTTSTSPSTSTTGTSLPYCTTDANGMTMCVVEGRPLRRRRRKGLLLPETDGDPVADRQARTEYASVASFGELALRLIAVGAPVELVQACHRAALDEIRHALSADALAGRHRSRFGPIAGLLGRRIGGTARSRRAALRRIAVESYVDGWLNERAAAAELRRRATSAASADERVALLAMADDEDGHADLARQIVTWCFDEDPATVGPALAAAARG